MNPRVKSVQALPDYKLELSFDNGQKGIFSVEPYLDYPVFSSLKDEATFRQVKAVMGFVSWNGEIDIDPDTLYLESEFGLASAKRSLFPQAGK